MPPSSIAPSQPPPPVRSGAEGGTQVAFPPLMTLTSQSKPSKSPLPLVALVSWIDHCRPRSVCRASASLTCMWHCASVRWCVCLCGKEHGGQLAVGPGRFSFSPQPNVDLTWLALRAPFWSCLLAKTSRMESRSSSSCVWPRQAWGAMLVSQPSDGASLSRPCADQ
jgi:hypothetical protein